MNKRLISLSREECETSKLHEKELINADCLTRREMVLIFGDIVSKRPQLVNLFFGILLHVQLLQYLGKDIKVKTDDHTIIEGTLIEADEGKIQIENRNGSIEVDLDQICVLEIPSIV